MPHARDRRRTFSSTSVKDSIANDGAIPVASCSSARKPSSVISCSPQSVWWMRTTSSVPSRRCEIASDRITSSDHAAGVSEDMGLPSRARGGKDVEAGVHARDDGEVERRADVEVAVVEPGREDTVVLQQVVDRRHPFSSIAWDCRVSPERRRAGRPAHRTLDPMTDLFADAAATHQDASAPLPQRIRPRSLDELVGQRHVLAEGSALRLAIEADRPPSMILYGPPGVGKTTLARIVAERTGAAFEELSAVSARVDDVRGVLQRARDRLGANGARTILFLDEIHRFNKGQQDALLPGVESGLVTLIGATTENPYFEVNAALISRCAVIELEPLTDEEVAAVVARGATELGADVSADVAEAIVHKAGGDARSALSTLELAWQTAVTEGTALEPRHVTDAARKRPLRYDRAGDQHYDIISAFIKSMRGGDADASVYYLAAMLEGGEDARFIARRMIVLASEDIGNADPRAPRRGRGPRSASGFGRSSTSRRPRSTSPSRRSRTASAQASGGTRRRTRARRPPARRLRATLTTPRPAVAERRQYVAPPTRRRTRRPPPSEGSRVGPYYVPSGNGEESVDGDRDG